MTKILGIIPARGGSKGIPKKNLYPLMGKPLIFYTISEALRSELITDLIVSTDNLEIKGVSEKYGAQVPFIRPKELSGDLALAVPTIQHATTTYEKMKDIRYDYIIMLQPTAPLRKAGDIDGALTLLMNQDVDSVISIVDVDNYHPMKMKVVEEGRLKDFQKPPTENPPRQSLPQIYIVNGAMYATKRDVLVNQSSFIGEDSLPYIMSRNKSVNIDNIEDFIVVEYFMKGK